MPAKKRTTSKSPSRKKTASQKDDAVETAKAQARKNMEKRKTERVESIKVDKYIGKYEELFNSIDKDHNGSIDADELMTALGDRLKWTPYRIDKLIRQADLNHDGTLDIEEFARIMEEHKDSMDMWGDANDSLWHNWKHRLTTTLSETVDVIEDMCQPAKEISRNHSTEMQVNVASEGAKVPVYMRRASPATRIIASLCGPVVVGVLSAMLCSIPLLLVAIALFSVSLMSSGRLPLSNPWPSLMMGPHLFLTGVCLLGSSNVLGLMYVTLVKKRTPGHYVFGLQMVDSQGRHTGLMTLLAKYAIQILLTGVTAGTYPIIDGLIMIASEDSRSLTDRLLDVTVVLE